MLNDIPEITDKYEILEKIGEGGMGAIFRVRHRLLDEVRVIKTIRPGFDHGDHVHERFKREARVAAKLRHPNIASIYDFSVLDDGMAYIVMEYIAGDNLFEYHQSGHFFSVEQVALFASQVLSALGYLHSKGFIHRDISTDNLMLTKGPSGGPLVKLIDLGLAKSLEAADFKTQTGVLMGKVRYISPEQISHGSSGAHVDARSDLYSFAIVLYELLTRELPITGDDQVSLIAGHLYRPPKSFDITDPGERIPSAMRSVLLRALEKNPEDRYATAAEFAAAIGEAIPGVKGMVPPTPLGGGDAGAPAAERTAAVGTPTAPLTAAAGERIPLPNEPTLLLQESPTAGTKVPEMATKAAAAAARAPAHPHTVPPPPMEAPPVELPQRRLTRIKLAALIASTAVVIAAAAVYGPDWIGSRAGSGAGDLDPEVPVVPRYGQYHAIVIGNNTYEKMPTLETAVNDARAVAELLEERYGFRVQLLEDASREQILNSINETTALLTERDNLLIYYAGHGVVENRSEYWQPVDADPYNPANWISTRHEVSYALDRTAAKHVLVIADSCYAGAGATMADLGSDRDLQERLERPSRLVLASGANEPVLDRGGGRHSVFAKVLLGVLRDNRAPAGISQLFPEVESDVSAAADQFEVPQTPTLAPIPRIGDEGGDFVFVPASS